jgi:peptide-methionine (S)-S-oxide reductase
MSVPAKLDTATLAGGCFWCLDAVFTRLKGVHKVVSGYMGGHLPDPDYKSVCTGNTGHAEVVQITFDPAVVSYRDLLDVLFSIHDPTTLDRQGNDRGSQYRSAIFWHTPEQRLEAVTAIERKQEDWPDPIVTAVTEAGTFYPAEDYHQDYYQKNPLRYKYYRYACGRDERLKEVWGEAKQP